MKISELNTQSFLGGTNVPANSYVLINYADSSSAAPVTKKVSVQELGKAIANDQQLYKKTSGGAVTTSVNNGAYVDGTAEKMVTASEKTLLGDLVNRAADPLVYYDCVSGLTLGTGVANVVPGVVQVQDDTVGYYTTSSSDSWTDLPMGGSGGVAFDSNEQRFTTIDGAIIPNIIMYNSNEEKAGYYADSDSGSWTPYDGTPESVSVNGINYQYMLYNACEAYAYFLEDGTGTAIGQPIFWDDTEDTLIIGYGNNAETLGAPVFWDADSNAFRLQDGTAVNNTAALYTYTAGNVNSYKLLAFISEHGNNFYKYESSDSTWTQLNVAFIDTVNGQTVIKDGSGNIVGTLGTYTPAT